MAIERVCGEAGSAADIRGAPSHDVDARDTLSRVACRVLSLTRH